MVRKKYEQMLSVIGCQEYENQNHNVMSDWLKSKRGRATNAGEDTKKEDQLYTIYGNVNYPASVENLWRVL